MAGGETAGWCEQLVVWWVGMTGAGWMVALVEVLMSAVELMVAVLAVAVVLTLVVGWRRLWRRWRWCWV